MGVVVSLVVLSRGPLVIVLFLVLVLGVAGAPGVLRWRSHRVVETSTRSGARSG